MLFGFPVEVWIIMAVEFAERAAYYGVAFMLMTYCTTMLRWSASASNAVVNTLYAIAPIFACVSSGLSDGRWGRPFSLLVFLAVYSVGIVIIALSSYPFFYREFPEGAMTGSVSLFATGMLFFAAGYGGMKVCTNPLMADSVTKVYKSNEQLRLFTLSQLFRWVYWVSNCASLVGILIPPLLRQLDKRRVTIGSGTHTTGYYFGFTMSAVFCVVGLVMVVIMYRKLTRNKPSPSFVLARILFRALYVRCRFATGQITDDDFLKAHRCDLVDFAGYGRTAGKKGDEGLVKSQRWLSTVSRVNGDPVILNEDESNARKSGQCQEVVNKDENGEHMGDKEACEVVEGSHVSGSDTFDLNDVTAPGWIADAKATFTACRIFVTMPIYWLITNRFSTDLVLQSQSTNLPDSIPPEVFNSINTISLLVSLIFFDRILFSYLYPNGKPPVRGRMISGFVLMIISVVWCGVVQIFIDRRGTYNDSGQYILYPGESMIASAWLVLPFILQGIASALVDTTVLEVAYVYAPVSMKGAVMALYLLTSSVSGFIGLALSPLLKPTNVMIIFFSLAVLLTLVMFAFYFLYPRAIVVCTSSGDERDNVPTAADAGDAAVTVRGQCKADEETRHLLCCDDTTTLASSKQYSGTTQLRSAESSVASRPSYCGGAAGDNSDVGFGSCALSERRSRPSSAP